MWVFSALLALPVIEIMLFVTVGAWLGLWVTLAIVIGSAVLGMQVIRQEGVGSLRAFQTAGPSDDPLSPLAHRALLVVAGGLLVVPGFLTTGLGLVLLVPAVRRWVLGVVSRHVQVSGVVFGDAARGARRPGQEDWIDAEYEEVVPDRDKIGGGSKWTRP